jgi:hypothetical protein
VLFGAREVTFRAREVRARSSWVPFWARRFLASARDSFLQRLLATEFSKSHFFARIDFVEQSAPDGIDIPQVLFTY